MRASKKKDFNALTIVFKRKKSHLKCILKENLFCILGIPLEITIMFSQIFFKEGKSRGTVSYRVSYLGDKYTLEICK